MPHYYYELRIVVVQMLNESPCLLGFYKLNSINPDSIAGTITVE